MKRHNNYKYSAARENEQHGEELVSQGKYVRKDISIGLGLVVGDFG